MGDAVKYAGAIIALLGALGGGAIKIGEWKQHLADQDRRIEALEAEQKYLHGSFTLPVNPAIHRTKE